MKKWTVVIEITDEFDGEGALDRAAVESELSDHLAGAFHITSKFQIMEIIEAPYGPNGVFLDERQKPHPKKIEDATQEVKLRTETDRAKGCTCIRFYDGSPHHKTCALYKVRP